MQTDLIRRAEVHAALGDPVRLAMVEDLAASDWSPGELSIRHGLAGNLLAHHLGRLAQAGLVERLISGGDRRRRYVRLRREGLSDLAIGAVRPDGRVLFVCTCNSARSQMAAALWHDLVGTPAASAGTRPAERVHPGAVAAAGRAGINLADTSPTQLDGALHADLTVTVCDRAHEDLNPPASWWHWSIPDPVAEGADAAFESALWTLDDRIRSLARSSLPAS